MSSFRQSLTSLTNSTGAARTQSILRCGMRSTEVKPRSTAFKMSNLSRFKSRLVIWSDVMLRFTYVLFGDVKLISNKSFCQLRVGNSRHAFDVDAVGGSRIFEFFKICLRSSGSILSNEGMYVARSLCSEQHTGVCWSGVRTQLRHQVAVSWIDGGWPDDSTDQTAPVTNSTPR